MIVRRFNQAGIEAFRNLLALGRLNPAAPLPREILTDDALTSLVRPSIEVEPRAFATRADAAAYLDQLLSPLDDNDVMIDANLWTWLTLFFFDEVCPIKKMQRSIKNDYSYIFEPKNPRHFYRHLLFVAWRVIKVAPTHNRLFLAGRLDVLDEATSEVMKRLYLTRIPRIFEVLDRLYWDENRGRIKSGVVSHERVRAGDLAHRFPMRIRQLEMTYDVQSLSADKLIELLGEEFQRARPVPAAAGK